MSSTRTMPLLLGTFLVGAPGTNRFTDTAEIQRWVDTMVQHGHPSIDTARVYGDGTAEEILSKLDLHGARVDTKLCPLAPGDHAPEKLKETFNLCLAALGPNIKIRVLYLHLPDRSVPFELTLEAVNDLYEQGHFEEFGLSNFMSWEVAEVVGICKRRGFVLPTVYQGAYNMISRAPEAELFPCLRKHGLKFAAYAVLAGGLLTGKLLDNAQPAPGSHFDPNWSWGHQYVSWFGHASQAQAIKNLKNVAEKHGLQLTDVAYRWLVHHSAMQADDHGIIVGGSNLGQIETAIEACGQGPLPDEVLAACEETWSELKATASHQYWF
ncbi:hypothetical protein NM688_g4119 [Phlebia brevispora]|uniref:Uncharacterized protein n=1 Tax=Phlebia brevispora TaxID=194682 RepID=A0ACC1T3U9_9APHY|nr:hypothetical protein NM688_g4119 [Phlebia brevispora]